MYREGGGNTKDGVCEMKERDGTSVYFWKARFNDLVLLLTESKSNKAHRSHTS